MITVYINLASRTDRRRSIEAQMGKEGVQAWRLEAATAADADVRIVTRTWDSSINCKYDTRTLPAKLLMSNGERGCAMSHAILWHACAANGDNAPPMLILEDDAVICPNFLARTRKLIETLERAVPAEQRTCLLYLGGEDTASLPHAQLGSYPRQLKHPTRPPCRGLWSALAPPSWRSGAVMASNQSPLAPPASRSGDVMAWRDEKESIQLGYGLREIEYVYQTSSYIVWPAAARKLLTELPVDGPADVRSRSRGPLPAPSLCHALTITRRATIACRLRPCQQPL
jgi:GR25 family glycosyltransferase involved in LPS biosynthesis